MVRLLDKTYSELSVRGKAVFVVAFISVLCAIALGGFWAWFGAFKWMHSMCH